MLFYMPYFDYNILAWIITIKIMTTQNKLVSGTKPQRY